MYVTNREKITLAVLAAIGLLAYTIFGYFGLGSRPADYSLKYDAARRTLAAELAIGEIKASDTIASAVAGDSVQAAMIGLPSSPITTDPGSLDAKITSTNPNFAAVIVSLLRDAGVKAGDPIAVAYTGSFPALNIATVVAIETLRANPIIVSSVGASTWGANDPDLTILDMESRLMKKGLISHTSLAASYGGDFRVRPMTTEGRKNAADAISRNGVILLNAPSISDSVAQRMTIYQRGAAGRPIKAFVNVGGGLPSTGVGQQYEPGLTVAPPRGEIVVEGLISRMQGLGVPVINLKDVKAMARSYKMPVKPSSTPSPGQGTVYRDWNQLRIVSALLVVALAAVLFLARFTILASSDEQTVDTYFGTGPRTFRSWLRSFGIRLPRLPVSQESPSDDR